MKFLVDAQLPRRLAREIVNLGGDALHSLDLPAGNRTPDFELTKVAIREQRIVVTKDSDFMDSYLLRHEPEKLLLISTGNITNAELVEIFRSNWPHILAMFQQGDFVELSRTSLILHS